MEDKRFQRMIGEIGALTPAQFKALVQAYARQSGQDAGRVWSGAVYSTSEQHLAALDINHACPGCGSIAVVQNGTNDAGIQRFRCQLPASLALCWKKAAFRGRSGWPSSK